MECDRVFVVLTAGPFPAGQPGDIQVHRHLLACAECRRIAAALRPHDEEMHEALPGVERSSLPRYRGVDQPAAAMATAMQGGARRHANPNPHSPAGGWRQEPTPWRPEAQVASFSLTPRRRTATLFEAVSMLVTLAAAAVAFWCLGVLAL